MKEDAGSAKNNAAFAMSEGSERRPSGTEALKLGIITFRNVNDDLDYIVAALTSSAGRL
jgi:hypothetical protein